MLLAAAARRGLWRRACGRCSAGAVGMKQQGQGQAWHVMRVLQGRGLAGEVEKEGGEEGEGKQDEEASAREAATAVGEEGKGTTVFSSVLQSIKQSVETTAAAGGMATGGSGFPGGRGEGGGRTDARGGALSGPRGMGGAGGGAGGAAGAGGSAGSSSELLRALTAPVSDEDMGRRVRGRGRPGHWERRAGPRGEGGHFAERSEDQGERGGQGRRGWGRQNQGKVRRRAWGASEDKEGAPARSGRKDGDEGGHEAHSGDEAESDEEDDEQFSVHAADEFVREMVDEALQLGSALDREEVEEFVHVAMPSFFAELGADSLEVDPMSEAVAELWNQSRLSATGEVVIAVSDPVRTRRAGHRGRRPVIPRMRTTRELIIDQAMPTTEMEPSHWFYPHLEASWQALCRRADLSSKNREEMIKFMAHKLNQFPGWAQHPFSEEYKDHPEFFIAESMNPVMIPGYNVPSTEEAAAPAAKK